MATLFTTPLWSMQVPDGWTIREGEDGPTFISADALIAATIQIQRLRPGTSAAPSRGADLQAWKNFVQDTASHIAGSNPELIALGAHDGLRSTQSSAHSTQSLYLLRADGPPAHGSLLIDVSATTTAARSAKVLAHLETMLGSIQAFPNRR